MPKSPPKPCLWCGRPADRLCDGAVVGGTCDAPVCSHCSLHLLAERPFSAIVCSRGRGGSGCETIDNRGDLCPFCAGRRDDPPLARDEHDRQRTAALDGPRPGERLWLIDVGSWVHRLYHACPPQLSPSGVPVAALIGFLRQLRKLRTQVDPAPRWILPVFDAAPDGGWRRRRFPGYKADRPEPPEDLTSQWPLIRELLDVLGVYYARVDGLEADDLIAAYTEAATSARLRVGICTNDKDLAQLLRDKPEQVRIYQVFGEPELRGPGWVREKFGVGPELLGDLLALAGDKSDGIPGAPGVGVKTAAKLLTDYGTLDGVIESWSLVNPHRIGEAVRDHVEQIRIGRELVSFAPVRLSRPVCELRPWAPSTRALDEFFRRLGYSGHKAALARTEDA